MVKSMFKCLPFFFKESGNWSVPQINGTFKSTAISSPSPNGDINGVANGQPPNKTGASSAATTTTFPSFKISPLSPAGIRKPAAPQPPTPPQAKQVLAGTAAPSQTPSSNAVVQNSGKDNGSIPARKKQSIPRGIDNSGTLNGPRKGVDSGFSQLDDVKIEKYDKDDRTKQMLRHAIKANDFMSNVVYKNRLELVVDCMIPESLPANTTLIQEGDPGSCFYVSAEGSFEVFKKNVSVSVFGPGVVFGELAILYKAKRFATVRAITDVKVWKLDRKILQKIMREIAMNEHQDNLRFLKSVKTFAKYDVETLSRIADLLKRELYVAGARIIRQGDVGDKFYLIRGGTVTVTRVNADGVEEKLTTLTKGAYFGDKALLSEERRSANIYANPPGTECLVLDKDSFLKHVYVDSLQSPRSNQIRLSSNKLTSEFSHIKFTDLKIIGTLGVGGFGRVELVEYKGTQTFALKCLKKIDMVQQQQQQHVFNEKNIMAKCNNKFIVKLFNTYKDTRYLYFLMEPCLGGDLWGVLQKHKNFDEKTSTFYTACVVVAFEYLHGKNIIYRDLKPENLMLDNRGYLKLIDFGFAKYIDPGEKTFTFAGTPEYVAPEIILNKGHDRSVDYWALGIFIHELMCGVPPFRGKDHLKTYTKILRGIEKPDMPSIITKNGKDLIYRLLRQIPVDRLGNQKEGIADIKKHGFFHKFDWQKLSTQQMTAPLVKTVKSKYDLSNFDDCPRDDDEPQEEISGWDKDF